MRKSMENTSSTFPGQHVRLSCEGVARVREMPEAWGLHRASSQGESGDVVEVVPPEGDEPARMSVEFPSGSVHNWPASCFEIVPIRADN